MTLLYALTQLSMHAKVDSSIVLWQTHAQNNNKKEKTIRNPCTFSFDMNDGARRLADLPILSHDIVMTPILMLALNDANLVRSRHELSASAANNKFRSNGPITSL